MCIWVEISHIFIIHLPPISISFIIIYFVHSLLKLIFINLIYGWECYVASESRWAHGECTKGRYDELKDSSIVGDMFIISYLCINISWGESYCCFIWLTDGLMVMRMRKNETKKRRKLWAFTERRRVSNEKFSAF